MTTAVLMPISWSRVCPWAIYPDAARGYMGGAQDPGGATGDGLFQINGTPAAGHVQVSHHLTGVIVASTFAASDGTWLVPDLPSGDLYDVRGRDPSGTYDDVVATAQAPYV